MLQELFSGLIDKEGAVYAKIQDTLVSLSAELGCPFKDLFVMIRPTDSEGNHKYYACGYDEKGNPKPIREISLKEIVK